MIDTIVIGCGPAGVSAAIYLKRFNREVSVIGNDDTILNLAHKIDNYYGFSDISGKELFDLGIKQLKDLDINLIEEVVTSIEYFGHFIIKTTKNTYEAKRVILATGKARNKLKIKNAKEFEAKGLSYCATCDGFFYRNKKIGIIGSGSAMLHELDFLKNITKDITIFTDGEEFELEGFTVVKDKLVSFYGDEYLEGVESVSAKYPLDGMFVAIGDASTFDFIKHLGINTDEKNNIIVNDSYCTNIKNLYAIGDAIGGVLQIAKAVYDGMMVAHTINKELINNGKI